MKLYDVYMKSRQGRLNCSLVAQLLSEQPTEKEESHAHMHMRDGFAVDKTLMKDALPWMRDLKKQDWERDAHLFLPHQASLPLSDARAIDKYSKLRVYMDPKRSAVPLRDGADISKYSARSNLPLVAGTPATYGTVDYVKQLVPGPTGKMVPQEVLASAYASGDGKTYVMAGAQPKLFPKRVKLTEAVEQINATDVHTLFEDSESMIMHLTALLLSQAGQNMLWELVQRMKNGVDIDKTVGLFSKTAVHAVRRKFKQVNPAAADPLVVVRIAKTLANRKLTGKFKEHTEPMDHVMGVLGVKGDQLTVITFFPSAKTTRQAVAFDSDDRTDLEEPLYQKGFKSVPAQVDGLAPKLTW